MQTHPPATAYFPEPATELNRSIAVVNETLRVASRLGLGLNREYVSERLTHAMSSARVGTHIDVCVQAAATEISATLAVRSSQIRRELAAASRYSLRRVSSRAGLVSLLHDIGYECRELPRPAMIDHLPGTETVLLVRQLLEIFEIEGNLTAQLHRAGMKAKPANISLEQQMRQHQARVGSVAELGAGVVALESQRHTNLVWHQANRLEKSFPDHSAEDMLGWGWQGLRTAVRLYDPALGYAFSTYACSRIVGSIRDGVRSENPVPKRLTTYARKVAAAEERLIQELQRPPTLAEIAERIGSELSQIQIMPRLAPAASVEELTGQAGEKGTVPAWSVDTHDPLEEVIAAERRERIADAFSALSEEDAVAVRLLVMEQVPAAEAREITGATTRQLRQRTRRGLEQLAQHLAGELD